MLDLPKVFEVYVKEDSIENAEFVHDTFNPFAAFITFFWAIYKGVWWLAILFPVYNFALLGLVHESLINESGALLLQFAFMIMAGFCGNDWFASNLKRKGYDLKEVVAARNLTEAQHRFFGNLAAPQKSIYSTL